MLVFAQLVGFMSWRLAQIAKMEKIASSVASARITRTQMRWAPREGGPPPVGASPARSGIGGLMRGALRRSHLLLPKSRERDAECGDALARCWPP